MFSHFTLEAKGIFDACIQVIKNLYKELIILLHY